MSVEKLSFMQTGADHFKFLLRNPPLTLNCVAKLNFKTKSNLGTLTNLLWWYLQYPQYLTLSASDPCSSHNSPAN